MFDSSNMVDPELARLAQKFLTETAVFLKENWDNGAMGWPRKSPELCTAARSAAACRSEPGPIVASAPERAIGFVVGDGAVDGRSGGVAPVLMFVLPAQPLPPDLYVHWVLREAGTAQESEIEADAWQIWVPEVQVQVPCGLRASNGRHGVVAVPSVRMAV